ncbi:MAG: SWIM zinc finger family protein [Anaerolineae bacterium]|nr:SWIM zinc finger family protein [Anaerolineae bacterium]
MRRYFDSDEFFFKSVPIPVEGGIVARTGPRKQFGESWWASRWIGVLESFGWSSRLQRGRQYARAGQVLSIDLAPGRVRARVQGSRPTPYSVRIQIAPLSDAAWERVIDAMAGRAIFAVQLLAGEMPRDIEEAFAAGGASLFPSSAADIETHCSCPDWANPCKHIAAVYYLLGEAFDRDPFVLFRLRGRTQEEIVAALRARRAAAAAGEPAPEAEEQPAGASVEAVADSPLEASLERFWSAGDALDDMQFAIAPPEVEMALLRRLGEPPFWPRDAGSFLAGLQPVYRAATKAALQLAFGDEEG